MPIMVNSYVDFLELVGRVYTDPSWYYGCYFVRSVNSRAYHTSLNVTPSTAMKY